MWEIADIIVFEPDLLFSSRIESAAAKVGLDVKFVGDLQQIVQELNEPSPRMVILNLDAAEGKLGTLEGRLKIGAFKAVGYYSHVNAPLAEEARRVGIDLVLSRGMFVTRISEILEELSSG